MKIQKEIYKDACDRGWHDEKLDYKAYFMLIVSEVAELMEADRKNRRADVEKYKKELEWITEGREKEIFIPNLFKRYIKDTVEDELADIFIRVCDLAELMGIELEDAKWHQYLDKTLPEICFQLTKTILEAYKNPSSDMKGLPIIINTVQDICVKYNIDLDFHVREKMKYNRTRGYKHGGKKY